MSKSVNTVSTKGRKVKINNLRTNNDNADEIVQNNNNGESISANLENFRK
jgi:hypothetical protein